MKVKTRKLIAAITATALLGTAVGVSAFALSNSNNNDFGFKGTYSLNALAEEKATAEKITVNGAEVDATSTLTVKSDDETYTLFVTVVDTDDMSSLTGIKAGYTIGLSTYSGTGKGLSNVIYSSLTVNPEAAQTVTAAELVGDNFEYITSPKMVIAEVETATVGTNTAELTIVSMYDYSIDNDDFAKFSVTKGDKTKAGTSFTYYSGGDTYSSTSKVTVGGVDYTGCITIGGKPTSTNLRYFTITPAAPCTITLVFAANSDNVQYAAAVGSKITNTITLIEDDEDTGTSRNYSTSKSDGVKVEMAITQDMIDNNETGVFYLNVTGKVSYYYLGINY